MSHGVVLIYHRVIDLKQDPKGLTVHPERFEAQIKYLKKAFTILSLRELTARITAGEPLENCVVITFDDGYADNLYCARPILEKYQVPATVFITTNMVGSGREFWWDELERIFLAAPPLRKSLRLIIDGREHSWKIHDRETAADVYQEMHPLLKYLPHEERERIMDDLFAWSEMDRDAGRKTYQVLTKEEIRELCRGDLIEIGAHTLTHPVLTVESQERQQLEITKSGKILEQWLDRKTHSFSYPFGLQKDIDENIIQMVKKAGYDCGIANIQGTFDGNTDLYRIPRRIVRNWPLEEFQQKLENFLSIPPPAPVFKKPDGFRGEPGELQTRINEYLSNLKPLIRKYPPNDRKRKVRCVLFINHLDQKGGAAKVCYRIFKYLQQKKINSYLMVRKKITDGKNVTVIKPMYSENQQFLGGIQERRGWMDMFHYSSFNLKNTPEFQAADVVHLHNLHKNYFSLLALPELSCLKPVIWTLHDMFAFTGRCMNSYDCSRWEQGCRECPHPDVEPKVLTDRSDLLWQLKKIIYQYSDIAIVCPSRWLQQKLAKSILKDKKSTLIYNGVDETVFKNHNKRKARKHLKLPNDKVILLFVAYGGLKLKTKGGHLIENVLQRLAGRDILILGIGASGGSSPNLKALPYMEDEKELALYYAAADLFLYPSLADNFPLVVLESLSCGTPVISFNTGGIPEAVTHKKNGYIAEYNNIDDLVKGVEFFLENPLLMKKAGRNARRTVLEKFTLKRMIKNYWNLYRDRYREFLINPYQVDGGYKERVTKLLENYYGG